MSDQLAKAFQRFSLSGKTAIITGATGGIGSVIAVGLAEAGANIISFQAPDDPREHVLKKAVQATEQGCCAFDVDLGDNDSIQAAFKELSGMDVVPEILFNCAGVTLIEPMEDVSAESFDKVMDINFRAAYFLSQEFGKRLLSSGYGGKIIHVASMASFLAQTEISVYASSKAALRNLTRAISNEWAGRGITCNCISPGFIKTPMSEKLWSDPDTSTKVIERTSMKRWGTPDDLVGTAIFLCSSASDFITGEEIFVDGGVLGR